MSTRRLELQLTALVVGVFLLGMVSALRGREIFPFASWFLFSRVPQTVTSYELRLAELNGEKFEPARPLTKVPLFLRSPQSSTVRDLVQRLGRCVEAGQAEEVADVLRIFRAHFHQQGGTGSLVLVRLRYDPLRRWRIGEAQETELWRLPWPLPERRS
ncbi:MAG: hypothetical protein JSR82_23305 [Verrucomicrobia bacterium]|nr:hypothetical protein [Verrucomicrobiota bacterium]